MDKVIILFMLFFVFSCSSSVKKEDSKQKILNEVYSLSGTPFEAMKESDASVKKKQEKLEEAYQNFLKDSTNLEHIIWYGRRLAYLYRYDEAIDVYTDGLLANPEAAEIYRHRGHRYITLRKFDEAITDFEKAADLVKNRKIEVEPDGIPNKLNQPLSNLQFNIWYHWGLAYYLKGDFQEAERIFRECLNYSDNTDLMVATLDWLYMSLRRQAKVDEAMAVIEDIKEDMIIIENDSYFKRLLMYKGLFKPENLLDLENESENIQLDIVTQGYGVANWYYYHGDTLRARQTMDKILATNYWPAFGFIAAESDTFRGL